MKTLEEIIGNYKEFETSIEDRIGARLCQFLTVEQMKEIGFELKEGAEHTPIE